jgi:hypothetical protein
VNQYYRGVCVYPKNLVAPFRLGFGTVSEFENHFNRSPDRRGVPRKLLTPVSAIREMILALRLFLAPMSCDTRTRRRIEAAIAQPLYAVPGKVGAFQDRGVRYDPRMLPEQFIACLITSPVPLLGTPERFWGWLSTLPELGMQTPRVRKEKASGSARIGFSANIFTRFSIFDAILERAGGHLRTRAHFGTRFKALARTRDQRSRHRMKGMRALTRSIIPLSSGI